MILTPFKFEMTFDLHNAVIVYNSKTKHLWCIKLFLFGILMTRRTIWHHFQRNRSMFQFLTHVEILRSIAAILEIPQYVAYPKNVAYTVIKLSAKSHNFKILRTMDVLSCPTILKYLDSVPLFTPFHSLIKDTTGK